MRVLLVDDETLALERLRVLFADLEDVEIVGHARDGVSALQSIQSLKPDLVVLDIQMPGRNGLIIAAEIDLEPRPEVIFVTAHEHYAPDAFDVDAADYLLKPVRFDRLRQAVDRARRRKAIREQAGRAERLEQEVIELRGKDQADDDTEFWIPDRNGLRRVPIETINWIEAARDYVLLHTDLRCHMMRTTMAALAEKLAGSPLIRVHRSAFVRPTVVAEIRRSGRTVALALNDGTVVQVGPSYVASLEESLGLKKGHAVSS